MHFPFKMYKYENERQLYLKSFSTILFINRCTGTGTPALANSLHKSITCQILCVISNYNENKLPYKFDELSIENAKQLKL